MPHGPQRQKLDVALLASRLPEPIRKPAGFIGGLVESLVGADDPQSLVPVPAVFKSGPFGHSIKHLRRLAGGYGKVPFYHGTTADNAAGIVREGWKPLPSGQSAARMVGDKYSISPKEWDKVIDKHGPSYGGYGKETAQLSTAPYDVAERWSQPSSFPLGEVLSNFNEKARIFKESRRQGMSYGNMYEHLGAQGDDLGVHRMTDILDKLGIEDRMPRKRPGGAVFEVVVNAADAPDYIRSAAKSSIRASHKHPEDFKDIIRSWNTSYKDVKLDPKAILKSRIVKGSIEGPEG